MIPLRECSRHSIVSPHHTTSDNQASSSLQNILQGTSRSICSLRNEIEQVAPYSLVCDHYSQQEEKAARAAGPAAFFCKPPDSSWLHNRYYETRAGPKISVPEPQTQEKEHPSYSFSNHGPTNLESI